MGCDAKVLLHPVTRRTLITCKESESYKPTGARYLVDLNLAPSLFVKINMNDMNEALVPHNLDYQPITLMIRSAMPWSMDDLYEKFIFFFFRAKLHK